MTDVSANASAAQWWFRGAGSEKTFGPVGPEVLLSWAREGRIFPEDKVSPDQSAWGDARMLAFLAMDTVIVRPDGRILGPFNAAAIDALRKAGKVPEDAVVRRAADLLSPPPAEELRSLREAVRSAKLDAADARGEIARVRASRGEAERVPASARE